MEKVHFSLKYSGKNTALPKEEEYMLKLINKAEDFISRMRWHAHFEIPKLDSDIDESLNCSIVDESFFEDSDDRFKRLFRTTNKAPFVPELQEFEREFWNLIQNIKFKSVNSSFMKEMIHFSYCMKM